jgi:hypothetical protein
VVQTLPRDQATDVPLDTGIELTFSHEGVSGAESYFRIEPPVKVGSRPTSARWFVPRQLPAVATLYSVTLGAGVGVEGSDQTLAETPFSSSRPAPRSEAKSPPPRSSSPGPYRSRRRASRPCCRCSARTMGRSSRRPSKPSPSGPTASRT